METTQQIKPVRFGPTPEQKQIIRLKDAWKLFNKGQRQAGHPEMTFNAWKYNANIKLNS